MNVHVAKKIILDERKTPFGRLAVAASVVTAPENDDQVSFLDLVECLRRGNAFGKITTVDEMAALALYRRTGRNRQPGHRPYEDFITDAKDWLDYLKAQSLI